MVQSANKRKLRTGLSKCNQCTMCFKVYLTSWLSHVLPSAIATSHSYLLTRKRTACLTAIERNPSINVNMIPVIELYQGVYITKSFGIALPFLMGKQPYKYIKSDCINMHKMCDILLHRKEAEAVDKNIQVIKLRKELMQAQDHMTEVDKVQNINFNLDYY